MARRREQRSRPLQRQQKLAQQVHRLHLQVAVQLHHLPKVLTLLLLLLLLLKKATLQPLLPWLQMQKHRRRSTRGWRRRRRSARHNRSGSRKQGYVDC